MLKRIQTKEDGARIIESKIQECINRYKSQQDDNTLLSFEYKTDYEPILSFVSQQEFRRYAQELLNRNSNATINSQDIEFLNNPPNSIFPYSNTGESSGHKVLEVLKDMKDNRNNQNMTVDGFCQIMQNSEIHTKGITKINWRHFYTVKKPIAAEAYIAFCKALSINNWTDVGEEPTIYRKSESNNKSQVLFECLRKFDHDQQVNEVLINAHNFHVFLVHNPCIYSKAWMMRKLEYSIETSSTNNRIIQCLKIPMLCRESAYLNHTPLNIQEIKHIFNQKIADIYRTQRNLQVRDADNAQLITLLETNNLLVIFDINNYSLDSITQIIEYFWLPTIQEIRQKNCPGKILMFLLDTEDRISNSNIDIQGIQIKVLSPANPYQDSKDMQNLIAQAVASLNFKLDSSLEDVAQKLIKSDRTEKLIREIYKTFKCDTKQTDYSVWQQYP